ncbi:MAG: class I SAM-dependent methyltransferase [Patescibacteria group bacterium]|nr:class I SAM-dependent methyltransferase [Patescibacteria group bacterium]MDD5121560.1 class I SAM-dependent methyltransferase [Patescibacteria group bacterium]MDD5222052.1 class I SAM-dependent methyltransferase [Patescibacteria group bacterium]MDD5396276.1 class I SAM-dependent methyltransferase [Patescibacteria group bacterium]
MPKKYNPQKVKSFWNNYACSENKDEQDDRSLRVILPRYFINKYIPKTGLVLDAGGGTGYNTILMAKKNLNVILFDISDKCLTIAKKI